MIRLLHIQNKTSENKSSSDHKRASRTIVSLPRTHSNKYVLCFLFLLNYLFLPVIHSPSKNIAGKFIPLVGNKNITVAPVPNALESVHETHGGYNTPLDNVDVHSTEGSMNRKESIS